MSRSTNPRALTKTSVFVVYGRNDRAREALFAFLRSAGLRPLEWSQALATTGKPAPFIGEVLDRAFRAVTAVVVLLTPDDEGRLRSPYLLPSDAAHERDLTPQARQNVLFEAGLALGRHPDRTVIVQLGEVRPFSDIGGRHVVRMDDSVKKRQELLQRLEAAGCSADRTGTDWHTAGSFEGVLQSTTSHPNSEAKGRRRGSELPEDAVQLLFRLASLPGGATPAALHKKSRISRQRFEYCLQVLEDRELITRSSSTLREAIVRILPAGRRILSKKGYM
jgi:predicted nucleotide-binding protein